MNEEKVGSCDIERGKTQRTSPFSLLCLLRFENKDESSYIENNNNTILIHYTREWTEIIENTSMKTHISQQV